MGPIEEELRLQTDENQVRDKAILAFINLGEKLRAWTGLDSGKPRKSEFQDQVGASVLFNTIEDEIIPRLMLAHRTEAAPVGSADHELRGRDHETFLQLVLRDSSAASLAFFEGLLQRGIPRDRLYLDLLAGAARRLGEMWEQDACDFTDVTIGLCRLHEIVRKKAGDPPRAEEAASADQPSILLATARGDQHVFGVIMVAEFMRRAGWRVMSEPGATQDQLAKILRQQEFDVLGLSAARSVVVDEIADEISVLRAASRNQGVKILVGGRLFAESPELVDKVGADGFAEDAKVAAQIGRDLLAAKGVRC